MKIHKKLKYNKELSEEAKKVQTEKIASELTDDEDDVKQKSTNFFSDLKESPSLRIVTFLLVLTLVFFLGMRYIDFRNAKIDMEYSAEFASTKAETTSINTFNDIININIADKFELMQLKGIGEVKAEAIIDYRETVGQFNSIEDIKNVKGIGENIYNSIKDYITV